MPTTTQKRHPIALLTDFGLSDHFVGVMKGVIISMNPSVRIIDISHEVPAHDIANGGYLLWSSYRYFPPGTIFVCVVDPGVGSSRRILGVRTRLFTFLAPDNGLLDLVLSEEKHYHAVRIKEHGTFIAHKVSSTFHGRDVFAPIAADLSLGISLSRMGSRISLPLKHSLFFTSAESGGIARILHIDRFGNLITNLRWSEKKETVGIVVGGKTVRHWIENYAEAPAGRPSLILGSSGLVEIVVKEGKASEVLGVDSSVSVKVVKI